mmetsp:Transcript_49063/g.132138  ORF Transcript_49063/g.132138 Transcript_49063/m.132138 type:complete len:207 (+) Transcript_49063:400-1020(+)
MTGPPPRLTSAAFPAASTARCTRPRRGRWASTGPSKSSAPSSASACSGSSASASSSSASSSGSAPGLASEASPPHSGALEPSSADVGEPLACAAVACFSWPAGPPAAAWCAWPSVRCNSAASPPCAEWPRCGGWASSRPFSSAWLWPRAAVDWRLRWPRGAASAATVAAPKAQRMVTASSSVIAARVIALWRDGGNAAELVSQPRA